MQCGVVGQGFSGAALLGQVQAEAAAQACRSEGASGVLLSVSEGVLGFCD